MGIDYTKILTKGYQSSLDNTSIEDGKIRFTTDTGQLYLDDNGTRIEITDIVKDLTEEEIKATIAPLPKLYLSSDTNKLFLYKDDEWINVSSEIDSELSDTSENAIQNKVVKSTIDNVKITKTEEEFNALSEEEKNNGNIYYISDKKYIVKDGIAYGKSEKFECTMAEYNALPETKFTDGISYYIKDMNGSFVANDTAYNNTNSGLTSGNVQDAIDEIANTSIRTVKVNNEEVPVESKSVDIAVPTKVSELENDKEYKTTDTNTTYTLTKVDGEIILTGSDDSVTKVSDENTTYEAAGTDLGLVKSGGNVTISSGIITVDDDSHNHIIENIDGLQTALDGKSNTDHNHNTSYYLKSEVDTKLDDKLDVSLKGSSNGLAELDENGKVPSSQLPSYVDDVIEGYLSDGKFYKESAHTTQITGESGKIYIDLSSGKTYRWTGSTFGVISDTLALGETSSTAYRGDRGKIAYDHSQVAHAPSNAEKNQNAFSNVKVGDTTIAADTTTDTLTLVAGSNVTITPDATNDKITIAATDTTYSNFVKSGSSAKAGLVPAPSTTAGTTKYLREDGTWQVPPDTNTTYSNFVKSGSSAKAGLVPAPSTTAGTTKYLREDGTWQVPPNTTYSNAGLGQGYGTCSTAAATAAKVVTLSNYALTTNGIVSVKFTYDVPASATMNINSKGAKAIYHRGAAIGAGIIKAGDTATFIYNGTYYHLIATDSGNIVHCTQSYYDSLPSSKTSNNVVYFIED